MIEDTPSVKIDVNFYGDIECPKCFMQLDPRDVVEVTILDNEIHIFVICEDCAEQVITRRIEDVPRRTAPRDTL